LNKNKLAGLSILSVLLIIVISLSLAADQLFLQPNAAVGVDAFVNQNAPTTNYGSNAMLAAGESSGSYAGIFIKFDVSSIPSSANITDARIQLYFYTSPTNPTNLLNLSTRLVTSDWSESIVTWNTKPSYSSQYSDKATLTDGYGWVTWDFAEGVQRWVNGSNTNYGIAIVPDIASANTDKRFYSSDHTNSSLRPILDINYTIPEPPNVTMIWPLNNTEHGDGVAYVAYNVTSSSSIDNCSLIIGGTINDVDTTVTKNALQFFKKTVNSNGSYQIRVDCADIGGFVGDV